MVNRFNLEYPINRDLVERNYHHLDTLSLMSVGSLISELTEEAIDRVMT